MAIGKFGARDAGPVSRRTLLRAGAGLAGGALLPSGLILPALAEDQPALFDGNNGRRGHRGEWKFTGDFDGFEPGFHIKFTMAGSP